MKIKKYNSVDDTQKNRMCVCMVIDQEEPDTVYYVEIFEKKEDMDNWILNIVNKSVSERGFPSFINMEDENSEWNKRIHRNENNKMVFTELEHAITYYQTFGGCWIYNYSECNVHKNIKLNYGVSNIKEYGDELLKNKEKYNI